MRPVAVYFTQPISAAQVVNQDMNQVMQSLLIRVGTLTLQARRTQRILFRVEIHFPGALAKMEITWMPLSRSSIRLFRDQVRGFTLRFWEVLRMNGQLGLP